jgi:hypothetical protein
MLPEGYEERLIKELEIETPFSDYWNLVMKVSKELELARYTDWTYPQTRGKK